MTGPTPLAVNDVYETAGGERFRILRVDLIAVREDEKIARAIVYPMQGRNPWPRIELWDQLQSSCKAGRLTKVAHAVKAIATTEPSFGSKAVAGMKLAWGRIEGIVRDPQLYVREGRKAFIAMHAKKVHASPQTIVTHLRHFWYGGQTRDALYPNYHLRGVSRAIATADPSTGRQILVRTSTSGRRPNDDAPYSEPYPFGGDEREAVVARALALLEEKKSTNFNLYKTIVKELYSYTDGNGRVVPRPLGERPTPRQFRRAVNAKLGVSDKVIQASSKANYQNNAKAKTGTVFDVCACVGHHFEIDSTIADVLIVARDNRLVVIGKATLYIVIDRFSRLVVGFHVSLDAPSWANALEAILTVAEDKREMCARWGYEYNPTAWLDHPIISSFIVADRGNEYVCKESEQIASGVAVGLINEPSQLAVRKGMVEMSFHVVHVPLKEDAPGYLPPFETNQRQVKDRTGEARYSLDQLAQAVLTAIETHNRKIAVNYRMENCDVLDGMPASPIEIWKRDYARSAGHMSSCLHRHLRWKLLPKKFATVTQFGLRINGCFYGTDVGEFSEWFVAARHKVSRIWVTYDRRLVDTIWVHNRTDPLAEPTPVSLNSHSSRFAGLSLREVLIILRRAKQLARLAAEHNLKLDIEAKVQNERLRTLADAQFEAVRDELGASGRHDKHGQWRNEEAGQRRVAEASAHGIQAAPVGSTLTSPPLEPALAQPLLAAPDAKPFQPARTQPLSDEELMNNLMEMHNS